jgi:hypothetical protein
LRTFAALLCLLCLAKRCAAQDAGPATTSDEQTAQRKQTELKAQTEQAEQREQKEQQQKEQQYQHQKKSTALAVTLEAICPVAGIGAFYAGDSDKATALTILSAVAAGAGVGSALELIHLSGRHPSGGDRVLFDFEQGGAWTVLVIAGVVYVLTRVSGLALAPEATAAFNFNLREQLRLPSEAWAPPIHALAPGPTLTLHF